MKLFGKKGKDAPDNSDLGEEDLSAALDSDLTETPVGDAELNDPNLGAFDAPGELDAEMEPKTLSAPSRKLSVGGGGGKRNLLILALLVVIAGGGGAYFYLMSDSEDYKAPVHVTAAAPVAPIADAPPQPAPAMPDPLAAMPPQPGMPQIEPSPMEPAQTGAADPMAPPANPPADPSADPLAASADSMLPPADDAAAMPAPAPADTAAAEPSTDPLAAPAATSGATSGTTADPAAALGQPPADDATPVAALPAAAPGEVPPEMPSPDAMAGVTGADTVMPPLDSPDTAAATATAGATGAETSATATAGSEAVPSWAAPGTTAVPGTTNPAVKPTSPTDAELAIVQNAAVLDQLSRPADATGAAQAPATTPDMPFNPDTQKNDVNAVLKQLQQNTEVTAVRRPMPPSYMTIKKERDAGDVDSRLVSARTALSQGRNAAALELFEDLHHDYPKDKRALMGRAVAMQKLGQDENALAAYEAVLNADPKNIDALTNMLGLLKSRDPGLAVEKLQQLRDAYPYQGDITAQLGIAYAANGQYDQALKYLDMAESLKPGSAYVLYNRSVLLDRMGRTGDAALLYRRILRMAADGELDQPLPLDSIRNRLAVLR